jgi:hypothetical protein
VRPKAFYAVRANEKFHLSPTYCCDGLNRQIDALVYDLYALTPAEIKIVEGADKQGN